jgi:hypothetical protein
MNEPEPNDTAPAGQEPDLLCRRQFLQGLGKWSAAAIAAVLGSNWLVNPPDTKAGGWVNRRGGGGGGAWVNRRGGGGGGWVNRYGGGGGGWINRWGGGGGGWVNRGGGGGGWINRW